MDDNLIRQCISLPNDDKASLIKMMVQTLVEDNEEDSRFNELLRAATAIVGDGILSIVKTRQLVIGRMMIAYQMREEGYKLKEIGRCLGRHHASILQLVKSMQNVLDYPRLFRNETKCWQRFQELIKYKDYEMQD